MVLPLISAIASIAIAATLLVAIFLSSNTTDAAGDTSLQMGPVGYVLLFVMHIALAYITIFFKTALLCGADERMQGGEPSLGSALSGAMSRAGKILPWAIVTATVSVVLRSLEATGVADLAQLVTRAHPVADLDGDLRHVAVPADRAVPVPDLDLVAVAALLPREDDGA